MNKSSSGSTMAKTSQGYVEEEEVDFFAEHVEDENLPDEMKDAFYIEELGRQMQFVDMKTLEQCQFEVHGISKPLEEDPEMVETGLTELDRWIDKLKRTKAGKIYIIAEKQSIQYVSDRKFRLMFLRVEDFDAKSSARRLLAYFEKKMELWGEDKLCKDITLDDFDEDDLEALNNGCVQILRDRDVAGRAIVFHDINQLKYKEVVNHVRMIWYMMSRIALDEDTQKLGVVHVVYKVGKRNGIRLGRNLTWQTCALEMGLPIKTRSLHLCFGVENWLFYKFLMFFLGAALRNKIRAHEGSHQELLSILMTFGIPKSAIPLDESCQPNLEFHASWIQREQDFQATLKGRKRNGERGDDVLLVDLPRNKDVIFGRGKKAQRHVGNLRLRFVLEENLDAYNQADNDGKGQIVASIISSIKAGGGRFLKQVDGNSACWGVVPDRSVRSKIGHDFRTVRKIVLQRKEEGGNHERENNKRSRQA